MFTHPWVVSVGGFGEPSDVRMVRGRVGDVRPLNGPLKSESPIESNSDKNIQKTTIKYYTEKCVEFQIIYNLSFDLWRRRA